MDFKEAYMAHEWQEYRLNGRVDPFLSRLVKNRWMKDISYFESAKLKKK